MPQRAALEHALRRTAGEVTVDPATVALGVLGVLRSLAVSSAVVVAVDDLQWMDAPSLRALTFAFRRLDGARVGLVATVRAGFDLELTRLAERDGNAVERIELDGLEKAQLAHLVFERTGRALTPAQLDRLARLSAGNPYYALELAAGGDAELAVPESLAAALRTRLESLSGTARATGLRAATLGRFEGDRRRAGPGRAARRRRRRRSLRERVVRAPAARVDAARDAYERGASRRPPRTGRGARGSRRARPPPRSRDGGGERDGRDGARDRGAPARRPRRAGDRRRAGRARGRAHARRPTRARSTRRLLKAADLYQAAGEGRDHVLPLLEHLARALPAGPDRARALVRLGWLGAQMDTMPMSDSVAYQERALAEAGDTADVVTAAHAVLARLRGIGGDYRAALRHAELARRGGGAAEANLMFPSPSGELGIARFFAGEGLDEPLFEAGIELESTAGRVGEPYQSPRLQLGLALLYTGDSRGRGPSCTSCSSCRSSSAASARPPGACSISPSSRSGPATSPQAEAHAQEFVHLDRQLRGELSAEWYPSGLVAMHARAGRRCAADPAAPAWRSRARSSRRSGSRTSSGRWATSSSPSGNLEAAREALVPVPDAAGDRSR